MIDSVAVDQNCGCDAVTYTVTCFWPLNRIVSIVTSSTADCFGWSTCDFGVTDTQLQDTSQLIASGTA